MSLFVRWRGAVELEVADTPFSPLFLARLFHFSYWGTPPIMDDRGQGRVEALTTKKKDPKRLLVSMTRAEWGMLILRDTDSV